MSVKHITGRSFAFAFFGVLALGCAKDDPARVVCVPTSISSNKIGVSNVTTSYVYNKSNQVTSTTTSITGSLVDAVVTTYTYDNDGNIISSSRNSNASGVTTAEYTYDISHNLIREDQSFSGVLQSSFLYHYNSTLQLIGADYTYYTGGGSSTISTRYEYAAPVSRNPTKILSNQGSTWTYEYDTNPNPLKVLFVSTQPDNNVTKMTYTSGSSTITTYTYQYDANRYPVGRVGSDGEITTYTHSCK